MNQIEIKKIAETAVSKITNSRIGFEYFEEPFKHIVIDNFFEINFADDLERGFPEITFQNYDKSDDKDIEVKYRTKWASEFDVPDTVIDAVRIFNSALMLRAMSKIFGIDKLMSDPYFSGGGLNVSLKGGLLDVHVDGNYHDASGLNRRINAILYLNPGWEDSWGGDFGLYDSTGDNLVKKIKPLHNRLVIFDTNDYSYHGLPDPINFPEDRARKSIILYYYTKESRPLHQVSVSQPHSALWKKRGNKDKRGNDTRSYH
jgi:Rps23 Pro-64 3,4-dihydroxylase Tpa1-like proline 4-hydroxylase